MRFLGSLPFVTIASAILLIGCGSSGEATTTQAKSSETTVAQAKHTPTPEAKVARYMKERFGGENWYPLIARIQVSENVVIVSTKLTNPKTPHWNRKQAKVMCVAFLKPPGIDTANVLYDLRVGGSNASCGSTS